MKVIRRKTRIKKRRGENEKRRTRVMKKDKKNMRRITRKEEKKEGRCHIYS